MDKIRALAVVVLPIPVLAWVSLAYGSEGNNIYIGILMAMFMTLVYNMSELSESK